MSFEGIPYLYQNKNGSFRVLAKDVDEYFKATEKDKAIKFAKGIKEKLDKELKGFITRQELGKKLGIKDVAIESAKMGNTRLWNEISNQMEIKKVGKREYYKFKGKEKDAIDSIKKFSGIEALKGARDFYAGKETVAGKIRKILNETEVPLNVKEIQAKLPKGTKIATIKTFLADVKTMPEYAELKKKIKNIDKYESAGAAAVTKRKASAPYIIAVRNTFVNDPDADTQDVAEGMFGTKKYRSASKLDKFDMDQMARLNIIRFLQEVGGKGSKVPVPGFKDISPNKLGDIIESIESRTGKFGFEPGEQKRFQQAIADSLRNLPVNYTEKLKAKLKQKGMAVDEVNPTASVFRQAPGYIEATQVIPFETNKIKGTTLDALFGKTLPKVMAGDFSGVDNFNQKSVEFAKKYNIDTPIIRIGTGLNPEDYVTNFSDYTKGGQENIKQLAKEKGFVIETKAKPLQLLVNEISKLKPGTKAYKTICELGKFEGGPVQDCVNRVAQEPEKFADKFKNITAESGPLARIKNASVNFLKSPGVKRFTLAGAAGAGVQAIVKEFKNDDPTTYLSNEDQQKNMLVDMVTQPIATDLERPAILDYQLPALGATVAGATALSAPSTIKASRSRGLGVERKGVARTAGRVLGRGLGVAASPALLAPLAALDITRQVSEGDSISDLATDPLNYLYPAFADQTPKLTRGLPSAVRGIASLGMSPAALRVLSRAGILGFGASLGLQGMKLLQDD